MTGDDGAGPGGSDGRAGPGGSDGRAGPGAGDEQSAETAGRRAEDGRDPEVSVEDGWWGRPLAETRSVLELARLLVDPVLWGRGVPRGDGRGVLLLPGFLAGDPTMVVMSRWLRRVGYAPAVCGFVANVDCAERALDRVERGVGALYEQTGQRVAVVGHSRGGHLARAVATAHPDRVSHAVSLGADLDRMFGISIPTLAAVAVARGAVRLTGRARRPNCFTLDCACRFAEAFAAPFPTDRVRLTSIYSRGDGVVRWERAKVPEADCIQITGSHTGMAVNRAAYRALAASLALPELAA